MAVDDVSYHRVEHSIAEELQPLVVHRLSFFSVSQAFVHECLLVVADVAWVEPDDVIERRIKLLILAERELYDIQ